MRLTIEITKKVGLPNYGSTSATIGIALDVADAIADEGDDLAVKLEQLQQLARALVEADLGEQLAAHPADRPTIARPTADRHQVEPATDADGWPEPVPVRPGTVRDPGFDPQGGKQLYTWSKKQEEAGIPGVLKRLMAFGKGEGYPARIVECDGVQTHAALKAIRQPKGFSRN